MRFCLLFPLLSFGEEWRSDSCFTRWYFPFSLMLQTMGIGQAYVLVSPTSKVAVKTQEQQDPRIDWHWVWQNIKNLLVFCLDRENPEIHRIPQPLAAAVHKFGQRNHCHFPWKKSQKRKCPTTPTTCHKQISHSFEENKTTDRKGESCAFGGLRISAKTASLLNTSSSGMASVTISWLGSRLYKLLGSDWLFFLLWRSFVSQWPSLISA